MEGYVLEISNLKCSKSESKTEYFDMSVQTEKRTMRVVCFHQISGNTYISFSRIMLCNK